VTAGSAYSFEPGADDTAGYQILWFAIHNKPAWATFDTKTGLLTGTPTSAQAGTYSNISIYGSDGHGWASTSTFSITVNSAGSTPSGTATLHWTAPIENTNGSALTNLAGYRIYYGTSAQTLNQSVDVPAAGATDYVVEGLSEGTWYFAVAAYTNTGLQSTYSSVVSKTIS
jgi:hypothetical protein